MQSYTIAWRVRYCSSEGGMPYIGCGVGMGLAWTHIFASAHNSKWHFVHYGRALNIDINPHSATNAYGARTWHSHGGCCQHGYTVNVNVPMCKVIQTIRQCRMLDDIKWTKNWRNGQKIVQSRENKGQLQMLWLFYSRMHEKCRVSIFTSKQPGITASLGKCLIFGKKNLVCDGIRSFVTYSYEIRDNIYRQFEVFANPMMANTSWPSDIWAAVTEHWQCRVLHAAHIWIFQTLYRFSFLDFFISCVFSQSIPLRNNNEKTNKKLKTTLS